MRRRSRSVPEVGADAGGSARRRRRRGGSSFKHATALPDRRGAEADRSHVAWLWVLGLLVIGALAFAWYLHEQRSAPRTLPGEAPSAALLPCIDPILAPLEPGESGCTPEMLAGLASRFREEREKSGLDDKEIFGTAAVMAEILQEAAQDRTRHIDKLLKIGSPVHGASPPVATAAGGLSETERRHFEAAVGVSWQRNSGAYRNRIEELWMRLVRLERGRFQSTPAANTVPSPVASFPENP
ncbi:MAG: hypothetical protein IAE97_05995 [Chthoniobacterales bacterium]|nr:hypothetical protein [Chthoniobacterales bacterium]